MKHISYTHVGNRKNNMDAIYTSDILYIVCDGVGSTNYGEVAAQTACKVIGDYFSNQVKSIGTEDFNIAFIKASKSISNLEVQNPEMKGMATTIVLCFIDQINIHIAWIGDSRAYLSNDEKLVFVSEDHSLVNELKKSENLIQDYTGLRNIITKSMNGNYQSNNFSYQSFSNKEIKTIFLCTDGVLEQCTEDYISKTMTENTDIEVKSINIQSVCKDKTKDNYTYQIIEL
jgi:serine/threonine protein phosphatase PrpC